MTTKYDDYVNKFETVKFKRIGGILEMTLHTGGGRDRWVSLTLHPSYGMLTA